MTFRQGLCLSCVYSFQENVSNRLNCFKNNYNFSNTYAHGSHGPDYVDYGAYTGGYGAFGWYSDHPVGGGYHR